MTVPTPENPFYSVGTIADMMDVSAATVREWINEEKLKAQMVNGRWRVFRSDFAEFVNKEYGDAHA